MRRVNRFIIGVEGLALCLVGCGGSHKVEVPYSDSAVDGAITFFDAQGHVLTGGSVGDMPFAARAVESNPATPPYNGEGRKATLYMAQPRAGVEPSEWNTYKMTPSSIYADPAKPTAMPGSAKSSLNTALSFYPGVWGGFVQMRIYLSAPMQEVDVEQYASANLIVSGNHWQQISTAKSGH